MLQSAFTIVAAIAVQITALVLLGRYYWCKCGELKLWVSGAWSTHTSQHLFDPYSFSHLQHGMIFYLIAALFGIPARFKLFFAAGIEVAWEIVENSSFVIERYRTTTASLDYYGDSIGNSVGDLISCLIGFFIASYLPRHWSVAMYVLIEIVMLITIRDCLTLNVLMLIAPIQVIKHWQVGVMH